MTQKIIRTHVNFSDPADSALWMEELNKVLTPEDWHEIGAAGEPSFNAGFSNATGFETAAYRRVGKLMFIKGRIQHSSNLNGVAIFTITDSDYIPRVEYEGPCAIYNGSWVGAIMSVTVNGVVTIVGSGTITSATLSCSFYLDN